jgi:hypothetical protein
LPHFSMADFGHNGWFSWQGLKILYAADILKMWFWITIYFSSLHFLKRMGSPLFIKSCC